MKKTNLPGFVLSMCLLISNINVFAQANTALSNLGTTSINADLVPSATNLRSLGSSAKYWKTAYIGNLLYMGGAKFLTYTSATGLNNTGLGISSLLANTTGYNNTGLGASTLHSNTSGFNNVAVGFGSLFTSVAGHNNVAIGALSLYKNTSGVSNSAMGNSALTNNTTGSNNMAIGANALQFNTSGNSNVAIGIRAMYNNTTSSFNVAIGDSTLFTQQTGLTSSPYPHIAIGSKAMYNTAIAGTDIAIGDHALYSNQSGGNNTVVGDHAMYSNTGGSRNTVYGPYAMYTNTSGTYNNAFGSQALGFNTTGTFNTAMGELAGTGNRGGSYNTVFGASSLTVTTNSQFNTAVGYNAGSAYDMGYNNTILGANCDVNAAGLYNVIAIGQGVVCDASSQARIGNSATNSIGGWANWSNISDGRFKKNIKADVVGLEFIKKLVPVTYNLDITGINRHLNANRKTKAGPNPDEDRAIAAKEKSIWSGFIAQDVEKAAAEVGYNFSGVDKPQDEKGLYALRYAEFVVPLVKSVQQLADSLAGERKRNDSLQAGMDSLKHRLDRIEAMLQPGNNAGGTLSGAHLQQNTPNPFHGTTTIQYGLPTSYSRAKIMITDISGKVIKEIPVNGTGNGTVQIQSGTLSSGSYPYALYVDGQIVGTKQMLVVK